MNKLKNLSEIQSLLQSAVQLRTNPNDLLDILIEKPPISVSERLNIYQEAYQIRLLESLREDFISVESILDPDKFEELALGFIKSYPSKFKNLAEYSEGFAHYIYTKYPEHGLAAYTDWLEILSTHAQYPLDAVTADQIQAGTEFNLQVHPATQVKKINDTYLVTYRNQDEVENTRFTEPQYQLLQFLNSDKNMNDLTSYAENNSLSAEELATHLHNWIKNQIIYCKHITTEIV